MFRIIPVTGTKTIEPVARLAREIWTEHYTPIIGKDQVDYMLDKFQSATAIRQQLDQAVKYFLLEQDEEPVGYLSYRLEKDHLFLSKIYVLKSQRGKGIGKKALEFLKEQAGISGIQKIKLTVNKYNSNSIRAYEKMGFVQVDAIVQDIGNGFVMDDYVLEKTFSISK
ncbi:GNAT family N-acetyltransferase [Gramella sp. GC03-9]|uniref:GNAT family N-acetyltransferase n=1 Tax=Christiangramia oceanisediminis TaxID=2920386 RepID=A0A9X2I6Z8_9FLAO|nr:GNAT family N-acetyltransferase [Gramella oceanisediminis]MCP9198834.1 GNAT family N-acetyltransferase [Gramella oceanisediminis]